MGMTRTSSSTRYHMASAAQVRILPLSRDFFFAAARRPHIFCAPLFVYAESVESAWWKHVHIPHLDLSTFGSKFLVWKSQLFKYRVPQLRASTEHSKPRNSA
jgi:hypothetical protein